VSNHPIASPWFDAACIDSALLKQGQAGKLYGGWYIVVQQESRHGFEQMLRCNAMHS